MKKVFVFDLDGTLLDSNKKVSSRVIKNLKFLNKSSHEIVFATARPPRFVASVSNLFPFNTHSISYNGAWYKTNHGETISFSISKKIVKSIIKFLENNDPRCIISTEMNDKWITYMNFDFKTYFNDEIGPKIVSKQDLIKNDCTKILINNCTVADKLKSKFSDICNIIVTDDGTLIQIMNITASKENAVKHLIENMGMKLADVICFGDDHNDIGLFKTCGTSVAMGNSIPELKNLATHITETNDNEGISRFIEINYMGNNSFSS